jgi:hypothetical protein
MQHMKHTRTVMASLLGGAILVAAAMAACGGSIAPTPLSPTTPTITTLPSIDEMLSEKTLGSASAPNTITEYVSFWCVNCRDFHLTGDGAQMKTQLADTGRAQIIFRNLFLSGESLSAAMLARCAGNARFFDAAATIFQNQASWLGSTDPDTSVQRLMLGFGMSQSVINSCVSNAALQNGVALTHTNALSATYLLPDGTQRVGSTTQSSIFGVPAIVVNGVLLDGINAAGSADPANAATLANVQKFLKPGT